MEYDFSGYVTKNDITCSDGRIIRQGAFSHCDGQQVPLVWQHQHNDPLNVLGHARLEDRDDGVYAYCKFNGTPEAENAKELVRHGDIKALSIYANQLRQQGPSVLHGAIREVSLVLAGANPGAMIDNVLYHSDDDDYVTDETRAVIYMDQEIVHSDEPVEDEESKMENEEKKTETTEENSSEGKTIQEVFDEMTEEQKTVVYALLGATQEGQAAEHSAFDEDYDLEHSELGGHEDMKYNIFEGDEMYEEDVLSHGEITAMLDEAKSGGSLKDTVLAHADQYGIENIDILFPDAKAVASRPEFIKRDDEWVADVLGQTKHTPFSRIKTIMADITADEARALGYIKGNMKKEEFFNLSKRITTPTTIYKKQKLDRDDIVDITSMDVVAWLKMEMRMMLNEEIARAILIGDGREFDSEDKINESNIRPVATDDDLFAHKVEIAKNANADDLVEEIIRSRKHYKGTGQPTLYTTTDVLNDMLLSKDKLGRRLYETEASLASALRVNKIVEVPVMEGFVREDEEGVKRDMVGIIVNLKDYNVGTDKGGEINMFDDFDIDFNQHKYLMETRMSGALVKAKSAIVIERSREKVIEEEPVTFNRTEPNIKGKAE